MSVSSVWGALTGFLTHHADELAGIGSALNTIVNNVPLDQQDKSNVTDVIGGITNAVENIKNFLESNPTGPASDVVIKESDLVAALGAFFASDAGKSALASAAKSNG